MQQSDIAKFVHRTIKQENPKLMFERGQRDGGEPDCQGGFPDMVNCIVITVVTQQQYKMRELRQVLFYLNTSYSKTTQKMF